MTELFDIVLAEREITRVLHRYCHAIDRLDRGELRSVYHPDAVDDHGSYSGSATGFVGWVLDRLPTQYERTQHSLSNITIEVRGDVAFSESYVTATHVIVPDLGGGVFTYIGRYVDRFEDRGRGWKIAHRKLLRTIDHVQARLRALDGGGYSLPEVSPHTDGLRSTDDPSYQR